MERQRRWQFWLIAIVIFLTVYNILPTVFYYSKPLQSPINEKRANSIALSLLDRSNSLEKDSTEWVHSFCKLLHVKPLSVAFDVARPQFITTNFSSVSDAEKFRKYLPRAGALIPFAPSQLDLYDLPGEETGKTVVVKRRLSIHFDPNDVNSVIQFSQKIDDQGKVTDLYRALVNDRALQIGIALGGPSEEAEKVLFITKNQGSAQADELLMQMAQSILSFTRTFGENSAIANRYYASFSQIEGQDAHSLINHFENAFLQFQDRGKTERITLEKEKGELQNQGLFLETAKIERLEQLKAREKTLAGAYDIVKRHSAQFASGKTPWTYASFGGAIQTSPFSEALVQEISLQGKNPFFTSFYIDWRNGKIVFNLYPDLLSLRKSSEKASSLLAHKDQMDQFLYNVLADISRATGEIILPFQDEFAISLSKLQDSKSFLSLRLGKIAEAEAQQIKETLISTWNPKHRDLIKDNFPIVNYSDYLSLPLAEQKLGLVIFAPSMQAKMPPKGMKMSSLYVIAKGVDRILQNLHSISASSEKNLFLEDFNRLKEILQRNGFLGYSAAAYGLSGEFAGDIIFEAEDYFQNILKATREDFTVLGTKRYAVLEFSDVEQRILIDNKIGNRIHEDLMKWRDDYIAAELQIKGASLYDVPAPTKSVLWDNFKLSFIKYFRGDERKILHWGLDLSGGKTVQIELKDSKGQLVTEDADLKQAINELYRRVNKMGISEVSIRREGNFVTLDFPGSQNLSAAELVKASSMYFNIVNEKFSTTNPSLAESVNQFLQEIWNEAVVTGQKEIEEINAIAWRHLNGDPAEGAAMPRSEAAKALYDNGLRLAGPQDRDISNNFNDAISKIAIYRGSDFTDWHGQTNPLLIVFRNYALEGSNLDEVHGAYDPSKGNYLGFKIKGSYTNHEGIKISPRDDLYAWTSQFSREKILGTQSEAYSQGRGWRMAVILNGTIISAPTLDSALRDSAMITGSFTQREINQLEADLKAGSLSFTPRILSEKNVSPELGSHERTLGIIAMFLSLLLVIVSMVTYYRFGGFVACIAVFFNLFIMWATLQNLGATLTLATIAGIILTLGMAVDANVLVFERIREEFALTGRIGTAIHAGYKKAFSAILDSNVTTIIAAFILLHFDSGPIKGFAVTLIIGIISSMFTALFMTRYFFAGWIQNPKNKELKMLNFIKATNFNFLKHTKLTLIVSTIIIFVGAGTLLLQRHSMFGMDFTGGYAINLELQPQPNADYRYKVEQALIAEGATAQELQTRELTPSNHIRLFLSKNLDQTGRPFYGMPLELNNKEAAFAYENNPKITWIVAALDHGHISLTPQSLAHLDRSWTEVSGQMSDTMRNNAMIGLMIALLSIMIYITVRFEFKYAISATIGLAHDVIFTVAAMAILHALGVPVQIDLITITALLTIIGYSLNDTIIVFDRIREDARIKRKESFTDVINKALNITLSRTLMTSGTTLLVLIPLVALGGSTLFGFALVMMIGVIFGTLSSLFIAAPLMLYFHNRELQKRKAILETR